MMKEVVEEVKDLDEETKDSKLSSVDQMRLSEPVPRKKSQRAAGGSGSLNAKRQSISTPDPAIASDLMTIAQHTRRRTIQNLWGYIKGKKRDTTVRPRSHYRRGTIFLQHLEMQKVAKGDSRFDHKFFEKMKTHYENSSLSSNTMIGLSIFQNGLNPVDDPFIVDNMPVEIQIGFRRKLFRLFSMQILVVVALIAIFSTSSAITNVFTDFWNLVGIFIGTIFLLFCLYLKKYHYPANFIVLAIYTVCMSVFLVGIDSYLGVHVSIFIFSFTFVVVTLLGFFCTLARKKSDGTEVLYGYLSSVFVAFFIAFALSCAVYFGFLQHVFGITNFFLCTGTIFILSLWFAYDAACMNQRLSPDEYMQGMIFFYTDMVMFIIFVGMVAFAFMACEGDVCCCGSADIIPIYPVRGAGDDSVQPVEGSVNECASADHDARQPVANGEIDR